MSVSTGGGNGILPLSRMAPSAGRRKSEDSWCWDVLVLEDNVLGPKTVSAQQDPILPTTYSRCCSTNSQQRTALACSPKARKTAHNPSSQHKAALGAYRTALAQPLGTTVVPCAIFYKSDCGNGPSETGGNGPWALLLPFLATSRWPPL